jgi:hypothetical protein
VGVVGIGRLGRFASDAVVLVVRRRQRLPSKSRGAHDSCATILPTGAFGSARDIPMNFSWRNGSQAPFRNIRGFPILASSLGIRPQNFPKPHHI